MVDTASGVSVTLIALLLMPDTGWLQASAKPAEVPDSTAPLAAAVRFVVYMEQMGLHTQAGVRQQAFKHLQQTAEARPGICPYSQALQTRPKSWIEATGDHEHVISANILPAQPCAAKLHRHS